MSPGATISDYAVQLSKKDKPIATNAAMHSAGNTQRTRRPHGARCSSHRWPCHQRSGRHNTEHKIRLTGIDAPERGQPFANNSKEHLASMVAGKEVLVESEKNDRYGRVLGKVWVQPSDCPTCGKTLDANHAQLLAGMAWWYRYYANEQSPKDRGRYESAEDEANKRRWGLWADPSPINPYDWRKGQR